MSVDIRRETGRIHLRASCGSVGPAKRDVDVVVGRHAWQQDVLRPAGAIGDQPLRVVEAADLILLKLYAGGSHDRSDMEQLLALDTASHAARVADERIAALPERSRELGQSVGLG